MASLLSQLLRHCLNALNDLSEKTMNFKYKDLAKKLCKDVIKKFYISEMNIFQKNSKINNLSNQKQPIDTSG